MGRTLTLAVAVAPEATWTEALPCPITVPAAFFPSTATVHAPIANPGTVAVVPDVVVENEALDGPVPETM
jgi:hypothetical protein